MVMDCGPAARVGRAARSGAASAQVVSSAAEATERARSRARRARPRALRCGAVVVMAPPSDRVQTAPQRAANAALTPRGSAGKPPIHTVRQVLQTPHVIEFRILGPLEVTRDDTPVALGGPKQRALLAYLLLRRGEVVSTDRLVDELWGEQPPRTATTSLQNLVSHLRKSLGPDVLVTRPPGYVLHMDGHDLDLARLERLVGEACEGGAADRAPAPREAAAPGTATAPA